MSVPASTPSKSKAFKQYCLLVEDTARLSDRRQTVSNIYLSANALLASGIALLAVQTASTDLPLPPIYLIVLIVGGGSILCLEWRRIIETYRALVSMRIDLLKELEDRPDFGDLIPTYHREDGLYAQKKRGFGFTRIEKRLPVLFIGLYVLALLGVAISHYPEIITQFATWGVTLPH